MDQKKLYRTIESVASQNFSKDSELLADVVQQIVKNEKIQLTGGRIWKFDLRRKSYRIIFQTGKVQKIPDDFTLQIKDYPLFDIISTERTILAD